MTWRAKQGAAKFRGASFFVETAEQVGGRQTVTHEVPFSEGAPFTEDLGLKGRTFSVDGYVIGEGYEAARDALLAALEAEGPGELVHPYHGTRRVAVVDYRVRQSRAEGGLAQFSISFTETSAAPLQPSVSIDGPAVVAIKADAARVAARAQFVATVPRVPFGGGVTGNLAKILPAIESATDTARTLLATSPVDPLVRAEFERLMGAALVGEFETMGDYFAEALERTVAAVIEAATTATAPLNPSGLLLRLAAFPVTDRPVGTTPAALEQQAAFDATVALVRRLALVGAAVAVVDQVFVSYDDAVAARGAVTDAIDSHAAETSDDTFPALTDLRVALIDAVPGTDADLPRLQRYTPPAVLPSLVVAHRLYGGVELEGDLVSRNKIRHPGFVPAAELEVLTDE